MTSWEYKNRCYIVMTAFNDNFMLGTLFSAQIKIMSVQRILRLLDQIFSDKYLDLS